MTRTRIPAPPAESPLSALRLALLLFFCGTGYARAELPVTSLFEEDWLKTVVSLEVITDSGHPQPIGTGFLVQTPHRHILLCTAQHVVVSGTGGVRKELVFRLNELSGESSLLQDNKLESVGLGGWFLDTTQDLACRFIVRKTSSDLRAVPVERFLLRHRISVGTPLMMLGFPLGLRSIDYATPIARRAMVALNSGKNLIVDSFAFPGNSGGPVVYTPGAIAMPNGARLENRQHLAGMVVSAITYVEKAVSEKTMRPRVTFEDNAGLTTVIPADDILRLIERDDLRDFDRSLVR